MSYMPVEKLIDKANGSVYTLVILASKRAQELADGAFASEPDASFKATTAALHEIAEGKAKIKK